MYKTLEKFWQVLFLLAVTMAFAGTAALADSSALSLKNCPDGDWCTYHRTYDGWRHSPLKQINKGNVVKLGPAWLFQPGANTSGMGSMGLQSTPLAIDGGIYLATNPSRVWKLDGATGNRIWAWFPDLDEAVVARSFFPHTRGLAIGDGRVYMGTVDGHVVALSETNGEVMWDNALVDSAKISAGFSGGGTFVNGLFIIGQNGGEYPVEGRIFGLDAATGAVKWTFYTTGRNDPEALATWGGDSWKYGGGGGWQPGSVDFGNNLVFWGTGNPNPDYDWGGKDWKTTGARPGLNLYTSSTVALDIDTGKLKWFFQEAPHDPYDYDASVGEYVLLDVNGKNLVLHPGKNGFNHVHDRRSGEVVNVYPDSKNINWTSGYNMDTGEWENMLWPEEGVKTLMCPAIDGGHSWNAGTYSPRTGLFYRIAQEWCMWLTVNRDEKVLDPVVVALFGAEFETPQGVQNPCNPQELSGVPAHAFLTAREPVSGDLAWEKRYNIVPHSSLLSTGGGLVFIGNSEGYIEALDATTGGQLWTFNNGSGHNGGIISYAAGGKQFILVTAGQGSHLGNDIAKYYGDKLIKFEHSATLVAFALPFSQP